MTLFIIILIFVAIFAVASKISKSQAKSYAQVQDELATKMFGGAPAKSDEDLMADIRQMNLCVELMRQSEAVGDKDTHDAVMNGTYQGPWPEPRDDGGFLSIYDNLRILKIAGINYRQGISRYTGRVMSALVPEPQNEFDPDAIKIVAEDRHHLGYVPTDQTSLVRSMTGGKFPYRCECHIYQAEDEDDGHKFFYGFVYIVRKDKGE